MSHDGTDKTLKILLDLNPNPLDRLEETQSEWGLRTILISKYLPEYRDGWSHSIRPESCFYKRWFDFPDLGKRGWAIMFHIFDPVGQQMGESEKYPGWVPPERVAEADAWIAFLNAEVRDRLAATARASFLDDLVETFVRSSRGEPLAGFVESEGGWELGTARISNYSSAYDSAPLGPASRFFKRWFELPDLGKRGWAILYRTDCVKERDIVMFPGWVQPAQEADADRWIARLNAEIGERLKHGRTTAGNGVL